MGRRDQASMGHPNRGGAVKSLAASLLSLRFTFITTMKFFSLKSVLHAEPVAAGAHQRYLRIIRGAIRQFQFL